MGRFGSWAVLVVSHRKGQITTNHTFHLVQRCPTAALSAPEFSVALKNIHLAVKTKGMNNHHRRRLCRLVVIIIIIDTFNVA